MVLTLTPCLKIQMTKPPPPLRHLLHEDKGDIILNGRVTESGVPKIMKRYNPQWAATLKDILFRIVGKRTANITEGIVYYTWTSQ